MTRHRITRHRIWQRLLRSAVGALIAFTFADRLAVAQVPDLPAAFNLPNHDATVAAIASAGLAAAPSSPSGRSKPAFFFGYVEFDADPNAPGGVAGFGPWPQPSRHIAPAVPSTDRPQE